MKSGVMEVELFEREQKRERKERFLKLVGICLLTMVAWAAAQATTKPADPFTGALVVSKDAALKYVRAAANLILFFMFLSKIVPALTGGQKDNNWWEIIGIIAAVIIINTAETIWNQIAPNAVLSGVFWLGQGLLC